MLKRDPPAKKTIQALSDETSISPTSSSGRGPGTARQSLRHGLSSRSLLFHRDPRRTDEIPQRSEIHLISDEIYALLIWQNPEAPDAVSFESVLSIDTTGIMNPGLVHVLWGMSTVGIF